MPMVYESYLCHHGVKGMKWGVRKERHSTVSKHDQRKATVSVKNIIKSKKSNFFSTVSPFETEKEIRAMLVNNEKFRSSIEQIKSINRHPNKPVKNYFQTTQCEADRVNAYNHAVQDFKRKHPDRYRKLYKDHHGKDLDLYDDELDNMVDDAIHKVYEKGDRAYRATHNKEYSSANEARQRKEKVINQVIDDIFGVHANDQVVFDGRGEYDRLRDFARSALYNVR